MPTQDNSATPFDAGLFEPEELGISPVEVVPPDAPLAARMRPRTLDEYAGQASVVGPGTLLRRAIENDRLTSAIFWGPPGSGKSTLASIIAHTTHAGFENYSAVTSGVADIRKVIDRARERRQKRTQKTILFVDEIHRWNKSQQDALLPHVEDGTVVLIGATTENPYFEVNPPLISRSRIFRFERLPDEAILDLLRRALSDKERGLGNQDVEVDDEALGHLVEIAGGDARNALNALETAVQNAISTADSTQRRVTLSVAEEAAQQRALKYDKKSDEHYDTISAFIKSVRGSDPDAALYWLAKMLMAGEDPKFIARRLVILASEDIGNADPMGLVMANAAAQAVMFIGMPEAQLTLSQVTAYLAAAAKSNAATIAIGRAMEDIKTRGAAPVPAHLRDTHYQGSKKLGHGQGYLYPHDFPGNYIPQEYAPEDACSGPYYEPTDNGQEAKIKARMESRKGEKQDEGE
jgi:putative ATPase